MKILFGDNMTEKQAVKKITIKQIYWHKNNSFLHISKIQLKSIIEKSSSTVAVRDIKY